MRGLTCIITSVDILCLVLRYLKIICLQMALFPMFGLVPSSTYVWIDYGLEIFCKVLPDKTNVASKVSWPTSSEMKASSQILVNNRLNGRLMKGVFSLFYKGRIQCADYDDRDLKDGYYEGYTGNSKVTNHLVFSFFLAIVHAGVNCPGSWHDSKLYAFSGLFYPKLADYMTPPGYSMLGDS